MTLTCADCPRELGAKNRSGRCRSCLAKQMNADPAIAERRRAAIQERFADPAVMAEHKARLRRYMATMPAADRAARRERGKALYRNVLSRPDVVAKREAARLAPEVRQRQGQSLSDTLLPWCPRALRPLYRALRSTGVPCADARRAVEAEIIAIEARRASAQAAKLAKRVLTHEEQLARIAAGQARAVTKPDTRPTGPAYSLVGNATGML